MADIPKPENPDRVTCRVCGEETPPDREAMALHLLTRHPLQTVLSKTFLKAVGRLSYNAGSRLADLIRG